MTTKAKLNLFDDVNVYLTDLLWHMTLVEDREDQNILWYRINDQKHYQTPHDKDYDECDWHWDEMLTVRPVESARTLDVGRKRCTPEFKEVMTQLVEVMVDEAEELLGDDAYKDDPEDDEGRLVHPVLYRLQNLQGNIKRML